jgi:hypothetical protein
MASDKHIIGNSVPLQSVGHSTSARTKTAGRAASSCLVNCLWCNLSSTPCTCTPGDHDYGAHGSDVY